MKPKDIKNLDFSASVSNDVDNTSEQKDAVCRDEDVCIAASQSSPLSTPSSYISSPSSQ